MLALEINSTFIDLAPDTSVPISLVNPVFDIENIERLFSFPFTIPLTARNRKIFEHTNRLDVASKVERYSAKLWIAGMPFEKGIVEVQSANTRNMSIVFKNNSIRLKERMSKVSLNDLNIPVSYTTPFEPIYELTLTDTGDPDATAILIGINGEVYYGSTLFFPEFIELINLTYPGLASVGSGDPGTKVLVLDTTQANITEILLRPPAYELPEPGTYTFFDTVTSTYDAEITRVNTDFNIHALSLEAGNSTHVFAPVFAPNIYDQKNPSYKRYINGKDYNNDYSTQDALIAIEDVPDWGYTWAPQVFLSTVIDAIADKFDIRITGIFDTDTDFQKLVFFSNKLIDFLVSPEYHIGDIEPTEGVNIPATSFDLTDHLPDITCFDVIEYMRSNFGFYYRFKDNNLSIQSRKDKLTAAPKDWTKYFEQEYGKSFKESDDFSLEYDRYGDETKKTGQLEDIDGGTDSKGYTARFWTLFYGMRETSGSVNRTWKVSEFYKKGTSEPAGIKEDVDPILLFYHGLKGDNQNVNYPYLVHTNQDFAGNALTTFSLDWNGSAGRYEQLWKEIIGLETKGQEVDRIARIPLKEILELKKNWNSKIGIYSADGHLTALIKSVAFEATRNGIGLAKVKMLKV
jgi:hypothetical protein